MCLILTPTWGRFRTLHHSPTGVTDTSPFLGKPGAGDAEIGFTNDYDQHACLWMQTNMVVEPFTLVWKIEVHDSNQDYDLTPDHAICWCKTIYEVSMLFNTEVNIIIFLHPLIICTDLECVGSDMILDIKFSQIDVQNDIVYPIKVNPDD